MMIIKILGACMCTRWDITCISTCYILTAKPSEEKETREISNLSTGLSKGRDHGKPLENVSSKFFIGTEVSLWNNPPHLLTSSLWFTNFPLILLTSKVGYYNNKTIESVLYGLNTLMRNPLSWWWLYFCDTVGLPCNVAPGHLISTQLFCHNICSQMGSLCSWRFYLCFKALGEGWENLQLLGIPDTYWWNMMYNIHEYGYFYDRKVIWCIWIGNPRRIRTVERSCVSL